jgi:hypothetical protein
MLISQITSQHGNNVEKVLLLFSFFLLTLEKFSVEA